MRQCWLGQSSWPRRFATAPSREEPRIIDGIAAIVNGDIITYSQVRGLSAPRERLLKSQYHGEELEKQIQVARSAALQDLIDRQLIVQSFHKEKYELPEHFVDERVNDIIRDDFGGDRNTFIKTLQAQNYSLTRVQETRDWRKSSSRRCGARM